ncbi:MULTISPECIES: protein-methionine-sulfoxide reductase heme-binding subunit MsrQ [unclassified Lentilitoribacter]|jgi:sulfoxide reductase heme-binding subunit YedZ|uniref:protein-methionine-sulfoxide reductase heme-binding subunit MsrQ n=1 Tax=unclassified Lentilitoribacter TaxID=2647570 RepID=UPI0013A68E21|nr:protein-methionine-sulfoxide reductase heme-binding subunit MsrQ [Lentilitoribacter sp. Alg239-R112]
MAQHKIWTKMPSWLLYPLGFAPGIWLFYQAVNNQLGADPLKALENGLGEWALKFLILGLCITPLMRFFKLNLIKYRRTIGLVAFGYVVAHFTTYLLLDQQLRWGEIVTDIIKRPYITIGIASFLLLFVLAVTSNGFSIRRLGAAGWKKLHLIVYPAVILAALHYVMIKKTWAAEPLAYLAIAIALISLRKFYHLAKRGKRTAA